ncbi:nuclear RNA export factor 1-like [Lingula anatina]|uniref:Nuclear RNA export factor 1-like n=1 Tax=Lingula anatina TaxID=7574 RepID=A0A1S3J4T7_LINAN|nr:nuclear RNA export factor 1-like [Lingula anatina]|eukprot:XP_013404854.1 nuclear RNA export factor 1-like [Lingula anatina]
MTGCYMIINLYQVGVQKKKSFFKHCPPFSSFEYKYVLHILILPESYFRATDSLSNCDITCSPWCFSAVRKRFPKVLKLDGKDLPPPIGFDLESPTDLPTKQGSYFMNEEVKNLVVRFLEQYFSIYDSDDRQGLLEAYHNEATFSVNIAQNLTLVTNYPKYHDYLSESRNLVKVKDPVKRNKCLKQGKLNVVAALCNLPKTSHDANSFVLDVTNATQHLLSFIVSGIFKESDTKSDKPPVRYFSRHFVTVPQGSGIVIINEMLTITNATPKQVQNGQKQTAIARQLNVSQGAVSNVVQKHAQTGVLTQSETTVRTS